MSKVKIRPQLADQLSTVLAGSITEEIVTIQGQPEKPNVLADASGNEAGNADQ
jgi:hypothetical protein